MNNYLPKPKKELIFYEDKKVYATLASHPITNGHVVIVWKKKVNDLHLLNHQDYDHLMKIVDKVRNIMLKELKIKKIYLFYMDEIRHVHWHLIPRYNKVGFNILKEDPKPFKGKLFLVNKLKGALKKEGKNAITI